MGKKTRALWAPIGLRVNISHRLLPSKTRNNGWCPKFYLSVIRVKESDRKRSSFVEKVGKYMTLQCTCSYMLVQIAFHLGTYDLPFMCTLVHVGLYQKKISDWIFNL